MSQSESSVIGLLEGQAVPTIVETCSTTGSLIDQSRRSATGSGSNQDEVIVHLSTSGNSNISIGETNQTGIMSTFFSTTKKIRGEDIDATPPREAMEPFVHPIFVQQCCCCGANFTGMGFCLFGKKKWRCR